MHAFFAQISKRQGNSKKPSAAGVFAAVLGLSAFCLVLFLGHGQAESGSLMVGERINQSNQSASGPLVPMPMEFRMSVPSVQIAGTN